MKKYVFFGLIAFVLAVAGEVFAQGGPPLGTDDPGTPHNGNWEINSAAHPERAINDFATSAF